MERIDPFKSDKEFILPCSIYPFFCRETQDSFSKGQILLKTACLLHDKITLPGSVLVESEFLTGLLAINNAFIKEEIVIIDLRSGCNSFSDLIKTKYDNQITEDLKRRAEFFDSIITKTIIFDPIDTSNLFREKVKDFILASKSRARNKRILNELNYAYEEISSSKYMFNLNFVRSLRFKTYFKNEIWKAARVLYSVIGAAVTNSDAMLPKPYLSLLDKFSEDFRIPSTGDVSPLEAGHSAVLSYFSINSEAIDKLSASEIIEFKNENPMRMLLKELDSIIMEAENNYKKNRFINSSLESKCKRIASEISKLVYQRCEKEKKRLKIEKTVLHFLEEGAGKVIPFLSSIKKGIIWIGRRLSRKKHLRWLEKTSAPLHYYANEFLIRTKRVPPIGLID